MVSEKTFQSALFCMDSLPGEFEGYTNGSTWNGWQCPLFKYAVAERILAASKINGYQASFDPDRDAFFVRHETDPDNFEEEIFEAVAININGSEITVYPIGAYAWIWELCEQ